MDPLDPDFIGESAWASAEYLGTPLVNQNIGQLLDVVSIPLRPDLPFRRIYFYVEPALSAGGTDFFIEGELRLWKDGAVAEHIPASEGQDTAQTLIKTKSLFGISCLAGYSTSSTPALCTVSDGLKVITASKFVAGARDTLILNPHHTLGTWDKISYSVLNAGCNGGFILGVRVFLAVQSLNYAF
jgi:hypothetical protein